MIIYNDRVGGGVHVSPLDAHLVQLLLQHNDDDDDVCRCITQAMT